MSRKHLYWSVYLINLQAYRPAFLLKEDSNAGNFLINFYEQVFCRTPHCSLYFLEILCDDGILWTFLGTKVTFFTFLVPLLSSMVLFTPKFLVSLSFARICNWLQHYSDWITKVQRPLPNCSEFSQQFIVKTVNMSLLNVMLYYFSLEAVLEGMA